MNRATQIWGLLAACSMCLAGAQANRLFRATEHRAAAERSYLSAASQSEELSALRRAAEVRIFGEPPAEDFIARVNEAVASVGLPATAAGNIVREADRAIPGDMSGRRRRDMRIELRPVSPAALGRFLNAWNADNPAWKVRQVSLIKSTDRRADPGDFQATLTLSAEYTLTRPGNTP